MLTLLVLNILIDDALLFVLQLAWNHIIDSTNHQLACLIILRSVCAVEFMDVTMDVTYLAHVVRRYKMIDSIRQTAYQKVVLELLQNISVHPFRKWLSLLKERSHSVYRLLSCSTCPKEFLKIQLVHCLYGHTTDGNRRCLG